MKFWFRLYDEVLDDPKCQRLSGNHFKSWINLLCLACRNNGVLPTATEISFSLRMPEKKAIELIDILVKAGLLDQAKKGLHPHNWNGRQYKSDVSTERVRRFRKRHETVSETPPKADTEADTEAEVERDISNLPKNKSPPALNADPIPEICRRDDVAEMVSRWNTFADKHDLSQVQKLTNARKSKARARLKDCDGLEGWDAALEKCANTPGLMGKNDRGWKVDFDFLMQESRFVKLMEGGYDTWKDEAGNGGKPSPHATLYASGLRAAGLSGEET